MDLSLTPEQEAMRDSAERFVQKGYPFEHYLKTVATDSQLDADIWQQFAELGWLSLPLSEAAGGFDGDGVDNMVIAEHLGAGLVIEPFTSSAVLGGRLLSLAGSESQQSELGAGLADGSQQLAVAYAETASRFNLAWCEARAEKTADGYRLQGKKTAVLNGPNASHFIVSARSSGNTDASDGISLFLVAKDQAGLQQTHYKVMGGGCACELTLDNVQVAASARLAAEGHGFAALEHALDYATASACAEALGAMRALLYKSAEYAKVRKQFNLPIGSFQVLQHRLVDMFIEVEQSQSMVMLASARVGSSDRNERRRAVSAAKAYLGKSSKFVAQQAVQLHGGIGMTEELDVGHYFRRLTAFGSLFGDRDHHLEAFAATSDEAQPSREQQAA